jgi:hypothetical protein
MRRLYLPGFIAACATAWVLSFTGAFARGQMLASPDFPHLEKRDGMTKLIVDGHPFICVAGELANSTSSDVEATEAILPRLAAANLNTVLTVISWDLIEPDEGKFDFSMVDYQIEAARKNNLRLIFLWMASWKNGLSHYAPLWVKRDQDRFPRIVNAAGNTEEILSTLSHSNRDADGAAFAAVMRHIREVDTTHRVIAIQVENESGILGSSRDFCPAANAAFAGPVPAELIDYLQKNKDNLRPELKKIWDAAGDKTNGSWEDVFGKNIPNPAPPISNDRSRPLRPAGFDLYDHTDEIFMAWNYSSYIGYVAAAGKHEYPLPMYVNTWIVQPSDRGPGDYPSGGAETLVHDIWHAGAPAIDILAPDIYLPEYGKILGDFAQNGNPAWNPETRMDSNNCWNAFTQFNALCYSPFGMDAFNSDNPFSRTYGLINSVSGAIAQAQGRPGAIKLIQLKAGETPGKVEMGDFILDFTPAPVRQGFGRRGEFTGSATSAPRPTAPEAAPGFTAPALNFLNTPFLLIINTAPNEDYFATNGNYPFIVSAKAQNITAAPAIIERGSFKDGHWVMSHRYNGDDIMGRGYDIAGAAAKHQSGTQIPLGPAGRGRFAAPTDQTNSPVVFRVKFYQYQ